MQEISSLFKYFHLTIPLFALVVAFFIYQVTSHVLGRASTRINLPKNTKCVLAVSMALSYLYLIITSFQTLFMFVPSTTSYPSSLCPVLASVRMISYVIGRILVYFYFAKRTADSFKDSSLKIRKRYKRGFAAYLVILFLTLTISGPFIYFTKTHWIVATDTTNIGTHCLSSDDPDSEATTYLKYVFVWGSFNDLILTSLTILWIASKLFILIIQSENQMKNKNSRFSFQTTKVSSKSDINHASSSEIVRVESIESPSSPSSAESPKISSETFYKQTHDQNHIILLISKFLILLFCVVITTQATLGLFMVFREYVLILYSLDTFVNVICLSLTFKFNDKYYKHLCGGCCTRCCFPMIKTIVLQCSSYERHYKERNNIEKHSQNVNHCCIYCRCCCCGYCFDKKINWESTRSIYGLARSEIDLIVMEIDPSKTDKSKTANAQNSKVTNSDKV